MASISKTKSGAFFIQFSRPDGTRPRLWLGTGINKREAETIKKHVETLVQHKRFGTPLSDGVTEWLTQAPEEVKVKLAAVGLLDWEAPITLVGFATAFVVERRGRIKLTSTENDQQTVIALQEFFGDDRPIDSVDNADAKAFYSWLVKRPNRHTGQSLAKDTISRHIRTVRKFYNAAVIDSVVSKNPFLVVKAPSGDPSLRRQYVPVADAIRVIDACPDAYWRLFVALGRFAGMRVPSEPLALTWDAVNLAESRIVVTSPKVQHHAGGGKRVIPITEDFRQYLEDVLELNGSDTHVFPLALREKVTGERGARGLNLRTQLEKIIIRAGLVPWQKPFQNLRSSYESDLAKRLPLALAAKLVGNSSMTAMRHYIDVTDETFETAKAIRLVDVKASQVCVDLGVQMRERLVSETARNYQNVSQGKSVETLEIPVLATPCRVSQPAILPPVGIKPPSRNARKYGVFEKRRKILRKILRKFFQRRLPE